MSVLNLPFPSSVPKTDPNEVGIVQLGNKTRLYTRGKAIQLANQHEVDVQDQGAATWSATETIVIYFDGLYEKAMYVPTEPEFDYWQALVLSAPWESNVTPTVEFVQFAGANLLAGS